MVVFVLMLMGSFAQREYVAVLSMLPLLAVFAARSRAGAPTLAEAALAALGASAAALKPVFVLGLLAPLPPGQSIRTLAL